jgi:hypothetical protein
MRLLLLTCAETTVIDQATNRASLVNLFEEVVTPAFPIRVYSIMLFTMWEREPAEADTQAQITVRLNDRQLLQSPLALNFQQTMRCRAILTMLGLVLNEPGILVFEAALAEQIVGSWQVPVRSVPQTAETAPAPAPT